MSAVVPSFSFQRGWRKTEMTVQTPRLQSCPLTEIQESIIFRDHGDTRKAGRGLSPWKHPPWSTSQVGVSTREKKKKKPMEGPVFDTFFFFFFLFLLFKHFSEMQVFESFMVVAVFFRSLFSSASLKYSHTENNVYVSSVEMPLKTLKKGIAYLHQEVWGDSTFFWQSSQSSYMSVSRLSFLVICDMISDLLIPSVCV